MSKIVFIKHRPYNREKVGKPNEFVANEKKSIGGSMTLSGSVLKGISPSEERLLMPLLLGIPDSEHTFLKKSDEYFNDIKRRVPFEGIKLEVGLKNDEKKIGELIEKEGVDGRPVYNLPLSIEDYILYKYCLAYRFIANSFNELQGNQDAWGYLFSETESIKTAKEKTDLSVKAVKEYTKICDEDIVVDQILRTLAGTYKKDGVHTLGVTNPETLDPDLKRNILFKIVQDNPKEFYGIASDKNLAKLAEIYNFIDSKIIDVVGSHYFFESEEIGQSPENCVAFISAAPNSKKYATMKARLQSIKNLATA